MKKVAVINKNRGWRGLVSVTIYTDGVVDGYTRVFSFSEDMWKDLVIKGVLVIDDVNSEGQPGYTVLTFKTDELWKLPTGQRSNVIKDVSLTVETTAFHVIDASPSLIGIEHNTAIRHYLANTNSHTMSEHNMIGLHVQPYAILC